LFLLFVTSAKHRLFDEVRNVVCCPVVFLSDPTKLPTTMQCSTLLM
jgi:hypothetical protein